MSSALISEPGLNVERPQPVDVPPRFASPVDVERHGPYRIHQTPGDPRPLYRFSTALQPAAGRYHLYSGWFCPWAHRSTLAVALAGIEQAVSVSYVGGGRDARGWGFRPASGPDPVNGFRYLREAYEVSEPGFDGHVSVPTVWDRALGRVASNDYATLDIELATRFREWSTTGVELYPDDLTGEIDALEAQLGPALNRGVLAAAGSGAQADRARAVLARTLRDLDSVLAESRYLLGDRLTLADTRVWVTLVRYDLGANASGQVGPRLSQLPSLWAYARELFHQEAFHATTDLTSFVTPGARVSGWEAPPAWRPWVS